MDVLFLFLNTRNNYIYNKWNGNMKSLQLLKTKFDRLNINEYNSNIYTKLLSLDITLYKPIMFCILNEYLSIEDFRIILSKRIKYKPLNIKNYNNLKKYLSLSNFFIDSLYNRLNDIDNFSKELPMEFYTRPEIIDSIYDEVSIDSDLKDKVTKEDLNNLIIENLIEFIHLNIDDTDSYSYNTRIDTLTKKMRQIDYSNMLSNKEFSP